MDYQFLLIMILTVLSVVAVLLNLVENTLVAVVAVLIYRRQTIANQAMEQRMKDAIAEVKLHMQSPKILGALKKEMSEGLLGTLRGWWGGKHTAAGKDVSNVAKAFGGIRAVKALQEAKSLEEKAIILAEYGMEKYQEYQEKQKTDETPTENQEIATIEDYRKANMSPEDYAKAYAEGMKVVEERAKAGTKENTL